MLNGIGYDECVTCKACMSVCPQKCISFNDEYQSFFYPTINEDRCIKCNKCLKVCPAYNNSMDKQNPLEIYGGKTKNDYALKLSSSGGVFYTIASEFIKSGGMVVGAAFNENFDVEHIIVDKEDELWPLCGSKYVQSDIYSAYSYITNALNEGKKVLFVGTPCQTATIASYFKKEKENLFLIDFICHGIVSEKVFSEYKNYLEKRYHSKIENFEFRNKDNGWLLSGLKVIFANGKIYSKPLGKDLYMQGYFKNLNVRKSCSSCAYKDFKSRSNLTIGDFWGIDMILPSKYDFYGNSVIIVNDEKGRMVLNQIRDKMDIFEVTINDILKNNSGLVKPFSASPERENYFVEAQKRGFIKPLEKYLYGTGIRFLKNKIKSLKLK